MPTVQGTAVSGGQNINPTGSTGFGGIMPPTGSPGNYGYGTAGNPNPTAMNFGPTTTMNPAGSPYGTGFSVGDFAGGNWQSFGNEIGKIYGKGVGSELYGFLASGGGYNGGVTDQAIQAQIAAMQHQIQTGYGNLQSGMGAAGISPGSSAAALESSNYMSNAISQENAITAEEYYNMWNASMGRETNILGEILGDAAHHKQSQPGILGYLGAALGMGGQGIDLFSSLKGLGLFGGGSSSGGISDSTSWGAIDSLAGVI